MGPSEQTRGGGLIISLVFDVAFLIKTFFFFFSAYRQNSCKFCFYFSLKEKLRNEQAVAEDGNRVCPAPGISTQHGLLVAVPRACEAGREGLSACLLVAPNPAHHMVCFVCLK